MMNPPTSSMTLTPSSVQPKERREKILSAIKGNGRHTTNSLAELVGVTPKAIEKHLAKLKAEGLLVRIGPDKGGHWEVTESGK